MTQTDDSKLLSGILASLTAFLFAVCCLRVPAVNAAVSSAGNLNLLTYAGCVILFCLSFMLYFRLLASRRITCMQSKAVRRGLPVVFFAGNVIFLAACFLLEDNLTGGVTYKYIWHNLPFLLVVFLLAAGLVIFFALWKFRDVAANRWIWFLYYAALTVLIAYTFYTPNIFGRGEVADSAHGHAYFASVYNVYHGSAYTETTTSIYGHYALFYKLPMKLLGGSFTGFVMLTALVGALCFLCSFLTLHLLTENGMVRILGCLAMTFPILSMRGGYYWQLWPHRILFPAILTLFAALCVRHAKWTKICWLTGYLIGLAATVWNTESGLFCCVAWAGLWILRTCCRPGRGIAAVIRTVILQIAGIFAAFFGAWGLVNLYNLLQDSAPNSLREFLFPLLDSSYMTDVLHLDLPQYPAAYMAVTLLLLCAAAWGISYMNCFSKRDTECPALPLFAFFLSVLALGQLTYFINRPAYHNLDICHIPCVLLLGILADCGMPRLRALTNGEKIRLSVSQLFVRTAGLLSLCVMLTLCAGTVIQYSYNADIRKDYHDMTELEAFTETIAAEIPANTYGFGVSVTELYSMLGWATNCYTLDFTDLSVRPQIAEYIMEDIQEKGVTGVFVGHATIEKMESFAPEVAEWFESNFRLVKEYTFEGTTFAYYTSSGS